MRALPYIILTFLAGFACARDAQAKPRTGTVQFVYYNQFKDLAGARPFGKIFLKPKSRLAQGADKIFNREASRLRRGVSIPTSTRLPAGEYTANSIPFRVEAGQSTRIEIILQQAPRLSWYQRVPPWQSFALWAGAGGGIAAGFYYREEARWGREQAGKLERFPYAVEQHEAYADQSQAGAIGSFSLAAALAVGGIAYWILEEDAPGGVAFFPSKDGAGLVLGGRF